MDAQLAIKNRHSVRSFSDRPIAADLIEKLIDSARLAPTARNVQPWEFIVVTKKGNLTALAEITEHGKFIADCPCCIAVFCQDTKYYLEDGCAATENILISAADLGLASCWVAGDKKPYADKIKELLSVPPEFKLISLLALGYAAKESKYPDKRPLKEVLHWEKF